MLSLTSEELNRLVSQVFAPGIDDQALAILIDFPDEKINDTPAWQNRRQLAFAWSQALQTGSGMDIHLIGYNNVHNNNADLPETFYQLKEFKKTACARDLPKSGDLCSQKDVFQTHQLILAPTRFSATAPLKLLARQYQFRAATMPGFTPEMIPALRLDYGLINDRVSRLKSLLDPSFSVKMSFTVHNKNYKIEFDTRFRSAHASGGRFPTPGTAGNLPSGECYIVPYEGELEAESMSKGILPVQFDDEVVLYQIEGNKAMDVISSGPKSDAEKQYIKNEPAYANIAELGFGVLKDFGLSPTGEILLDEKLGLHIAFGRSDHFGGAVGVKDFSSADAVVHLDRIYIPETMPDVQVNEVILIHEDGSEAVLMQDGNYRVF